jgi:hypothetical protein
MGRMTSDTILRTAQRKKKMREPIVINAWMTAADARKVGISTSSPRSFRINTATGTLHKASCHVLDKVPEKEQVFIEDHEAISEYLQDKRQNLDKIKCGICCRQVVGDRYYGVGERIPEHQWPWWYELDPEKRVEVFNRLMCEHHFDVVALKDILNGDALEGVLEYRKSHGEEPSPFDDDIQLDLTMMFLDVLERVSRFMERERRMALREKGAE